MVPRKSRSLLVLICSIVILQSSQIHGRQSERRRKDKPNGPLLHTHRSNICDISDRNSKVHCYCEENQAAQNASKADCWIFNGGLPYEDPIWMAFSSQTNLIELNFNVRADGGLSFVPTKAIKFLRYLRTLTIKYANIDEVTPFAFANSTSLKEISLTRNKVMELKEYAFASLYNLTQLNLDDNKITEIRRDTFVDLPVLHKLYITNNNISVLHDGVFKQLSQLSDLDLDKNSIAFLTRETFEGLANLKKLDLRNNRLSMLGELTFAELWNLQELLLDQNALQYIAERAFDGLSQLKKLSMSENRLTSLTSGLFEGVRGMTSLDLRHNDLETLTFENIRPVIDNLKNYSSFIYLEGNSFDCDCRLSWMHMLRNDTKSEKVKLSLEQVTCHLDPELHHHLTNFQPSKPEERPSDQQPHSVKKQMIHRQQQENNNRLQDKVYNAERTEDHYDGVDTVYDEKYDYDMAQQDETIDNEAVENDISEKTKQKHLFQIPVRFLPCPEELRDPTDSPFTRPSQGEVKDFRNDGMILNPLQTVMTMAVVYLVKHARCFLL